MRNLFLILICVIFLNGCLSNTRFLVCGIDINEMKGKDFGVATLGTITAIASHVVGHHIAAKLYNVDIKQHGRKEIIDYSNNPSSSDIRHVARGGFIFQLAINTALVEYANNSYFTKGFTGATTVQLLTYDIRNSSDGDFNLINDNGGNGDLEHELFKVWSAYNFYRISFKKEQ